MADMDFYNRNLYRNYPFSDESLRRAWPVTAVNRGALLDIGIVFLPNAEFDLSNDEHRVLPAVIGANSDIGLYVYAPDAAVDGISFGVYPGSDISWQRSTFAIASGGVTYGFGWLVHGEPQVGSTSYAAYIASAPLTLPGIELRCIQVLDGHYINKFIVANEPRTVVPSNRHGMSSSSIVASGDYPFAPGGEKVQGDVRFREGYNCHISVISRNNAMRFSARRGAGDGEPCTEVPRTYAELDKAARDEYLDQATRCHEGISNINGVEADVSGNFKIQGGRGVEVTSPSDHTIRIAGHESMEECE